MTTTVFGVPEGWDAVLLARRLREHPGPVLHVCRDDARLARLAEALAFFAPQVRPLRFPAWDCLPYDRASPNPALVSERVATLAELADKPGARRLVLTTVNALVQKLPPATAWHGQSLEVLPGGSVDTAALARFLDANGYGRANTVMEPGEYAIRGGIIDVFPAGAAEPVRIDLFGETIESLRAFDPGSQRSGAKRERLRLRPISEVPLDKEAITRFRTRWRELFGPQASDDPLYIAVSEGRRHPGMEHYLPLFYAEMGTLLDLLPGASCSLDPLATEGLGARLEMIADHFAARSEPMRAGEVPYRPLPPDLLYVDRAGWDEMLGRGPLFAFSPFARPEGVAGLDGGGRPGPLFTSASAQTGDAFAQLHAQHERWRAEGRRLFLAAWSRGSRERLGHLLAERGFAVAAVATWEEARRLAPGVAAMIVLGLERGFVADDEASGPFAVVSEQDLLGERIARPPRRRKRADELIAEATELSEGDLVVHQDHGIGRYDGLVTLTVNEAPHDCLRILYDGDGKLFLPVENIEMLSRFGADGEGVALDRLGGVAWQHRKARAKERIRDMAAALIKTAAERKLRQGEMLVPPSGSFEEFCARFPHAETEDQTRAIADVLEDLASGQPMDRLVCGDVGFGKTEVALRAAFVAAMSGCQVAVIVPTTLLARQHFRTFSERFRGLPVKVAQLSRMVSAREAAEVRRELADGTASIVIGTHALLAKNITFSALGLLIVDEEQHFGVAHKEKLKALKADVHVLTLTATPIPRTLQLALSGVREMSLIATPPVDRLAVRTFIMPFDGVVIREAILRERFRGGQVFCVVPRIEDIAPTAERLAQLVPEARLAQAHGRLAPSQLERVMTEFSDGKFDILLSTNIVESGLDMPAVNTLIVYRADLFGLGQLYQLRGRVGRGKLRGYAYLTWPPERRISGAAEKRLSVLHSLDTLGAGFTLASHDLDIRGAGNLLGDEQSGHIREVGIELYQQMLEEAVAGLRAERGQGRKEAEEWTPAISLGLPVLIPEEYVADLPVRLGLYRRIAAFVSDAESEAMAAELVDRFGKLPEEVENLLGVVALKRACRAAGVEKLEAGPKGMVLSFHRNQFANPAGLVRWLATRGGGVRLRPDHKLALAHDLAPSERLKAAAKLVAELKRLASGG